MNPLSPISMSYASRIVPRFGEDNKDPKKTENNTQGQDAPPKSEKKSGWPLFDLLGDPNKIKDIVKEGVGKMTGMKTLTDAAIDTAEKALDEVNKKVPLGQVVDKAKEALTKAKDTVKETVDNAMNGKEAADTKPEDKKPEDKNEK
jgi:hypothetical protein